PDHRLRDPLDGRDPRLFSLAAPWSSIALPESFWRSESMKELRIWMNGKLVSQAEAVLPVNSAAGFYATNVFEGLPAYWNDRDEEIYAFRLPEHFTRLRESAKMMRFEIPYSDVDLYEAVREVLRGNEIRGEDIHMHLVAY